MLRAYAENSLTFDQTPTHDSWGEVVHPDILHFPEGWNGYEYWMAISPYHSPKQEYPNILVSHDGRSWEFPGGNPVTVGAREDGQSGDPCLIMEDNVLWIFWLWMGEGKKTSKIYRTFSSGGIRWVKEVEVLSGEGGTCVSPSVVKYRLLSGTGYRVYSINRKQSPYKLEYRDLPFLCADFPASQECTITKIPGKDCWHIYVTQDGRHAFVVYCDEGTHGANTELYFATSKDGVNWQTDYRPVLRPKPGSWDSVQIYRSCAIKDGDGYKLWYSAMGEYGWHLGHTQVTLKEE